MSEPSTVQDLCSRDLLEMHAAVARAYFPHDLQRLNRAAAPGVVRTLDLGPLTLGRIRWGTDITLDCDYAQDAYEVNVVLEGTLSWERDGSEWTAGPGEAAVFLPGKRSTITHWGADATVLGIKIDREVLHRHLAADTTVSAPLEETAPAVLDLRSGEGRSWVTFIRSSGEHIISDPAATSLPAFRDSLVASVAAPMANFLAPAAGIAPPGPYMVRRVRDAVERDPGRRWSLDDMAAISGVGRRRLQQAFRDYVGIAPTAWLLRVRLDHAYRLLAASDGETPVHEVAYACGFNHLSRFAKEFRTRFGCVPSEVTRRARENAYDSTPIPPAP
ncbi:AraC family transcriptional regulator [Corynebacterium halotolerans]|uniref:AraC family transcriptional regulator n=1 Tax=Corynebacterium halotolerans YIM 70093 = DSM 44683 TaxID=1121362 RepID=M1NL89_9CORY|nr:AraC family transcriptional regulator [Corynebacterium halotolerans]AGF72168.1 AraC family transcriptional regulator [Corynebacterium halotolerans YIM 70093 = DSM 44683]